MYPSPPVEDMSFRPVQNDNVTTPTSKKGSWANANGRAYPPPPYLPIPPNYGESGALPLVTNVPVVDRPFFNSMPTKLAVPLPALSSNAHIFTRVDAASNFPVALFPPGTSLIAPAVESQEKRGPLGRPHQYKKSRKEARSQAIPQFFCDDCDAKYVQRQGLNRHRQEKHECDDSEPSLCIYCDAKCGRAYEYREHLEKHHPDVDPDIILGKAAGSRRRTAYYARHRSQQVLLPTIEHGRWGDSGIGRYPPIVKPSTATLPSSDMTYVPELESTQPVMMGNSIPEGELAQLTWMASFGALQGVYSIPLAYPTP
ncbi:hypothetical protein BGY98DRAFT_346926 [Russula aff. rugulosa BPL654]|nr:hypothetical protein BGY98DRAFT_346926 [Russula aff. rugulosa BPL654]